MPGNPIKKGLFEISSYFSEHTMHLLDFLTESQNAISKILGAFHGNSCVESVYSVDWVDWTAQKERF